MDAKDWVPMIRDCFQILFFAVVATITILTYLAARKTVLQPIRTEIFKEQLKLFSELLTMFTGRGEFELREDFGFDKALRANATRLLDVYATHFFDMKFDENKRPYSRHQCPHTLIPESCLEDASLYLVPDPSERKKETGTPDTKAAMWANFKFDVLSIPKEFTAKEQELERMISSPLIPKQLAQLLKEYVALARRNLTALRPVLTGCATELPEKYPNLDVMKKASVAWINNAYNKKFRELEPKAKEINSFLRGYFKVESIMEGT